LIDPGLRGRVALVTGGTHGIGAATAQALAAQGALVFITYLRLDAPAPGGYPGEGERPASGQPAPGEERYRAERQAGAEEVLRAIREAGGRAEAWEADLSDPSAIPILFDRVEEALGPVEVLVNNAAHWELDTFVPQGMELWNKAPELWTSEPTLSITPESHDRHFAVNSRAVALMMAELARRHVARGATWGRIVNISTDGAANFPGEVSYGASKHALESYSRSAASELGRHGITVNIVSPGPTQTGWISEDLEAAIVPSIPLGRIGQPEDVADAIVFLASEQARWLTGQLVHVGGGHRM
jgi:3-oxoacyl-[acyl-carrier protein] reductase